MILSALYGFSYAFDYISFFRYDYTMKNSKTNRKEVYNEINKILENEEMIYVSWSGSKHSRYRLTISVQNRKGILADLLAKLSELNLNILSIELGIRNSEQAEFCQIEVESSEPKKQKLEERISQTFKLIEIISLDDAYNK